MHVHAKRLIVEYPAFLLRAQDPGARRGRGGEFSDTVYAKLDTEGGARRG